jgi:predicted DNA-binding transcriptional regulator AlpA
MTTTTLEGARLLREKAAADLLGVKIRTMQDWRFRGGGPPFIKLSGRAVRYRVNDLLQWVDSKVRASTSDDGSALAEG